MKLNIIRHCPTDASELYICAWKKSKRMPLNARGIEIARMNSAGHDQYPIAFTHTYRRTTETAELIIADYNRIPVIPRPELDEIDYGEFEGLPWRAYGAWLSHYGDLVSPPGSCESLQESFLRSFTGLSTGVL